MKDNIKLEGVDLPVKTCSNTYRKIENQNSFLINVCTCEPNKEKYTISKSMLIHMRKLLIKYEEVAAVTLDTLLDSVEYHSSMLEKEYLDIVSCSQDGLIR